MRVTDFPGLPDPRRSFHAALRRRVFRHVYDHEKIPRGVRAAAAAGQGGKASAGALTREPVVGDGRVRHVRAAPGDVSPRDWRRRSVRAR